MLNSLVHGRSWRAGALLVISALMGLSGSPARAADDQPQPLTERQRIIHVLNRLGYGPRPGDVEWIQGIGLTEYMRQQLHPETIDDSALQAELAKFDALAMSPTDLFRDFRDLQQANKQRQIERAEAEKKSAAMADASTNSASAQNARPAPAKRPGNGEPPRRSQIAVAELQDAKIISAVDSPRQLYEVLVDFWSNHFNIDVRKGPCRVLKVADERDVIRPHVFGKFRDLLGASAKSPAMLHYLDNFENSAPREVSPNEQRRRQQVIQQQNPGAPAQTVDNKPKQVGGLNENYAREIMELHTLGVDGGYTQKDVQEVARCFTGWGVDPQTGLFAFTPRRHDNGAKTVLGHDIPANGGIKDGETVLDILASHPSTAKFISTELCRRLVADDPPPALVDRVAAVFRSTDGDLRAVVQTIIYSPEFFSPQAYRAKIKSPFEFAVSAVRATGRTIVPDDLLPMNQRLAMEAGATFGRNLDRIANARRKSLDIAVMEMGQPLFAYQAPTGYTEDSRKWVNAGALIARMNFALALSEHKVVNVSAPPADLILIRGVDSDKPDLVLDQLNRVLLHGEMAPATRATLEKQIPDKQTGDASTVNVPELTALVLGSPEFQRH
ncbi:MAG TPA: DUF1800 domain-containing protein [Verrucomicrobiae bacterium]|nr:DUF1800 domain-containing protein [Verrucomicrobiae bacterium]